MLRTTLLLAVWTAFIWANRLFNIIDESSGDPQTIPIMFIAAAVVLTISLYLWTQDIIQTGVFTFIVSAFTAISISRWITSSYSTFTADESLTFLLIHFLLAGVTIGLCVRVTQMIWRINLSERKLQERAN